MAAPGGGNRPSATRILIAEALARLGPDNPDQLELSALEAADESAVPGTPLPLVVPIVVAMVLSVLGVGLVLRRSRG